MITLNDPKKRIAGEKQNVIFAPFGIDFSTTGNLIIRKINDDGTAESIAVFPKSMNLILIS